MSEANELLDSLSEDEIALYSGNTKIEEHIVIGENRIVNVPDSIRRIAVQYDHNVETITFDCPRYNDGIDLSEMYIYINYERADRNRGRYLADNVRIDETDDTIMHFDWTIGNDISFVKGNLSFLVCAVKTNEDGNEELHWNSELNTDLYISEGLECVDNIIDEYPDIITDLLTRMDKIILANSDALDTSLIQTGLAADAGAVGKALDEIDTRIDNIDTTLEDVSDISQIRENVNTNTTDIDALTEALNTYKAAVGLGDAVTSRLQAVDINNIDLNGAAYLINCNYGGTSITSNGYLIQIIYGSSYKFQLYASVDKNNLFQYRKLYDGTWGSWYSIATFADITSLTTKVNTNATNISTVTSTANSALSKANTNATNISTVTSTANSALSKANTNATNISNISAKNTGTPTAANGASISNYQVEKNNGFVHIHMLVVKEIAASSSLHVATLPSGYRPSTTKRGTAIMGNDGFTHYNQFTIASSGAITVTNAATVNMKDLYLEATFLSA